MKARLTPEADLDAQQAIQWYDARDPNLGDDFLRRVNEAVIAIEDNPKRFPVVHENVRRALIARFPYQILFEVGAQGITVFAIYHCARTPERWERRLKS